MRAVRRWVLRLLAVLALGGVTYGVVRIVSEGRGGEPAATTAVVPALKALADSQDALAARLDRLRPGREAPRLLPAIRAVRHDQERVVKAVRRRQARRQDVANQDQLEQALGAEFDYLDALGSVARNRRSRLLKTVGDRAQAAKDAFTKLPGSQGVEDGIRGTQRFIAWARAR